MTFNPQTSIRVIQFERLTELRMRRELRNRNNAKIEFLEMLLDLQPNECPSADKLAEMFEGGWNVG